MNRKPYPHQEEALLFIQQTDKGVINFPTGTGKSLIQAWAVANDIQKNGPSVHVILAPRILLANQLYTDIKRDLINIGIDAQYLIVNSGNMNDKTDLNWFKAIRNIEKENQLAYRELKVTTNTNEIINIYNQSVQENVPLVIIGNYQSARKIQKANLPIKGSHFDEAQYLVPNKEEETDFSWIVEGFTSETKHFYTATMRFTKGVYGMNTEERFGKIFSKTPAEMILAGRIVRPRIHLVDFSDQTGGDETAQDALAIAAAFREHQAMLVANGVQYVAAKMLVVAKGSEHLDRVVNSETIVQLRQDRPNLKIFDITSKYDARINGEVVTREYFLKTLRNLTDYDEAIIFHVRILCEGIDVPGITGIMPLNNLRKSAFLQTLGRATRLHVNDRTRIDGLSLLPSELTRFVKPYAWIIIPVYSDLGSEMKEDFVEMIKDLRTFGFNPAEDVFIKTSKGASIPKQLTTTTAPSKLKSVTDFFTCEVMHIIEEAEEADAIEEIQIRAANIKDEFSLIKSIEDFVEFSEVKENNVNF
jgi:hypothetical protein